MEGSADQSVHMAQMISPTFLSGTSSFFVCGGGEVRGNSWPNGVSLQFRRWCGKPGHQGVSRRAFPKGDVVP